MKISATASGGFSGALERYELDTERLANGAAIESLLQDIDFFSAAPAPTVGADIPRWRITVEDGQRRHSVSFADDGSAESARWQSLVARLRNTA